MSEKRSSNFSFILYKKIQNKENRLNIISSSTETGSPSIEILKSSKRTYDCKDATPRLNFGPTAPAS